MRRVLNTQGHSEDHRFQTITLVRHDQLVDYVEDLGLAAQYKGETFVIVSADEDNPVRVLSELDTVGALQDYAESARYAKPLREEYGIPTPDLIGSFRQAVEEEFKQQNHISTFGSNFTKQRNK